MRNIHTGWRELWVFLSAGLHVNPLPIARQRAYLCLMGIVCLYVLLIGNLAYVTVFSEVKDGQIIHAYGGNDYSRGEIRDRNSKIIAKSLQLASLVADPASMTDIEEAITVTQKIFPDIDSDRLRKLLSREKSRYAIVKRKISPKEQAAVNKAGIPGYYFEPSYHRLYPQVNLFSHVVGFSGDDNVGLMGLESAFDEYIRGENDKFVRISLDSEVQFILHEELSRTMKTYSALGGAGVVMDVKTREVIAMVSLPDFDPNIPSKIITENTFNRITQGTYEFGSTLKIINSALGLEEGYSITDRYYDATEPLAIAGGFEIADYHGRKRPLNIVEIFIHSSNIGSALMAMEIGTHKQKKIFADLGLLERLHTHYPRVAKPQYPRLWQEVETATISFGHGVSVTPLHFTNAVATLLGDGIHRMPQFTIQKDVTATGIPIISQRTISQLRSLMRLNVMQGSGKPADIAGYRVGGKTGTAEKINPEGGYDETKLIANFIAAFPIDNPQYVIFVMIDEPQQIDEDLRPTAGVVAAPLAGDIIKRIAPVLGLRPDAEKQNWFDKTLYSPLLQAKPLPPNLPTIAPPAPQASPIPPLPPQPPAGAGAVIRTAF